MPKSKVIQIHYWMYDGGMDASRDVKLPAATQGQELQREIHRQIRSSGNSWGCAIKTTDLKLYPIPDGSDFTEYLRDFTPFGKSSIPESAPLSRVLTNGKKELGVVVALSVLILRCGMFGSLKSTRPFVVRVPRTAYADELPEFIKQTRSSGAPTADLELYRINCPADGYPLNVTASDLMSPLNHEELSVVFPTVPLDDTVQVLVIHREMTLKYLIPILRNPRTIIARRDTTIGELHNEIGKCNNVLSCNISAIELYKVKCWSDKSTISDLLSLSDEQTLSNVFPLPHNLEKDPIIVGCVRVQYWLRGSDPDTTAILDMPLTSTVHDLTLAVKENCSVLCNVPNDRVTIFKIPVDVTLKNEIKELLDATSAFSADAVPGHLVPTQYLKDIFEDFPLIRPLNIVVEIVPEKARKHVLQRTLTPATDKSLAKHRHKFVEKAKSIPPSAAAKSSCFKAQQRSSETAVDCGRPNNRHGPIPLVLLHSVFAHFARDCATVVLEEKDYLLATRLIEAASGFHTKELDQVGAIDEVLKGFNFITTQTNEKYTTDKAFVYKGHHLAILEYKKEMTGITSDPYQQALSYYFSWTKETALTLWWSPLPCLLVIIVGPFIAFAGAAWNQRPTADMLSCFLPLFVHPFDTLARDRVARHLVAFRLALDELESYYQTLLNSSPSVDPICSQLFPYTTSYKPLREKEDHSKRFKYVAHVSQLLFEGEQAGQPVYIKFVQSYGKEAHQHLADLGCAPTLLGCEPIGGGWILVVMDKLCGYETLQACRRKELEPSVIEALHGNLCSFHKAGHVHGDIRDTNIMVSMSGDHLMVVDFDWAGRAGVTRYPGCVNHTDIDRPQGARDGKPIMEEHDDWMFKKIKALEYTRHTQSINAKPDTTTC